MPKIYSHGFPGLYGGAATELYHQIMCWRRMGHEVGIIPNMHGFRSEPLYQEMIDLGVTIHEVNNFEVVTKEDAVINFCSDEFLQRLPDIVDRTKRTVFVNCMTFIFKNTEVPAHKRGDIRYSLYQRDGVRENHERFLKSSGTKAKFLTFKPYFHAESLVFNPERDFERTTLGRISRQDADKFSKNTLHIYESIVSPKWKRGIFLGFNTKSKEKIGQPYEWIETYLDHNQFPVSDFWSSLEFCVQSTDTTENLPRIGFEAQFSGVPLVVDDRGGWKHLIDHGISGFLCKTERDFIYWGSRLSYEPDLRYSVALAAREKALSLSSYEVASESWRETFEIIFN